MNTPSLQVFLEALLNRLERQEAQTATTNDLLLQVVQEQRTARQDNQAFQQQQSRFNQLLLAWTERQEAFNERQEAFNERQDQFNIIFLEEIRDIKRDVRELKNDLHILTEVTIKQHDERLKRLEDFMATFMRSKAD